MTNQAGCRSGRHIGIVSNPDRDIGLSYTQEVTEWLHDRGYTVIIDGGTTADGTTADSTAVDGTTADGLDVYDCEFLIVLGGDGTMLRSAYKAACRSTPMLGINLGNMGYLTDVDRHDGLSAIEKMLSGDFRREQRMMLETVHPLKSSSPALNEVMIHRSEHSKLMSFSIHVNGDLMDNLRADGMIVATPTGSTAYNLSAGGPILRPDAEMIVVTAICPHTLYTRPWVLSGNDEITIAPTTASSYSHEHNRENSHGDSQNVRVRPERQYHDINPAIAVVSVDGSAKFQLAPTESVTIRRSEYTATVVKTSGVDFFEVLRRKLKNEG